MTTGKQTPKNQSNGSIVRSIAGMSCFIIMPFGVKADPATGETINFDAIHRELIQPVVEKLKLDGKRSDEVSLAGLIHKDMIDRIINSDVVIVDITTGNPNVMYELGVRHAACRSGTVIIQQRGNRIPFNIGGMRAMEYEFGEDADQSVAYFQSLLEDNIRNSLVQRNIDSLVHTLTPGLNVSRPTRPLRKQEIISYPIRKVKGKSIEIITGDIANIDCVNAWVNPENTRMEMGRMHDNSVSALIRYFGAKKDSRGHVRDDCIVKHLRKSLGRRAWAGVEPGTIVCTRAGELERDDRNKVQLLLHVAVQHSEPTQGYSTIRGYIRCMKTVLNEIDRQNALGRRSVAASTPLRSVLFPLFGTRAYGGVEPQDVTYDLFQAAIEYMTVKPNTLVERVAFLAYTDTDLEFCRTAAQRLGLVKKDDTGSAKIGDSPGLPEDSI